MLKLKTHLITLLLLVASLTCSAQFKSAMIGVNGLTCSACTRTVEMSIRKLAFVESVSMNLENTEGLITFKSGGEVDINKVAKAVYDAGFSVRYLKAVFTFSNEKVGPGTCVKKGKVNFNFINTSEQVLNGETTLRFLGSEFQTKNMYNKTKALLIDKCGDANTKTYFVSL